jgi:hypothetical protein
MEQLLVMTPPQVSSQRLFFSPRITATSDLHYQHQVTIIFVTGLKMMCGVVKPSRVTYSVLIFTMFTKYKETRKRCLRAAGATVIESYKEVV